uniref:Actin-related protein 9 n=1 Tax=Anthurium amnicola TaxID=1678845 RepID=A0A1D1Y848_9ARAE
MDYMRMINPSQLMADRGSNLVVINPGSAYVRIGLAREQTPFNIPHCIARHVNESVASKFTIKDQFLNSQATRAQNLEREEVYRNIASSMKVQCMDEDAEDSPFPRKMGRVDGYNPQTNKVDTSFTLTNVMEKKHSSVFAVDDKVVEGKSDDLPTIAGVPVTLSDENYKDFVCGEDALRISSNEPYCLCRPIRRGHFNVSQHYSPQEVSEDLYAIWNWIVIEKLHIPMAERTQYSVILVVPETFDNREIREMLSIVLRDLRFNSAAVHQEGFAATCGNGLATACVVNLGAQVTSVVCVEDGVVIPCTSITLPFGGEDISRCLLWIQQYHQTWPLLHTNPLVKPNDWVMLDKIKEYFCVIREGEVDGVAVLHSYKEATSGSYNARLCSLNVPPMGLFYPRFLVPEEYPSPPRQWFHDHEDMLEDTWHAELPRRPDFMDGSFFGVNNGQTMYDNNLFYPTRVKEENLGLAEAIASSILSAGRLELQRKLFCSIQLIGGVALTRDLVAAVEERVLHAIPPNEAIDTVEVLQSRTDPSFVSWRGGAVLGILDFGRETWIPREEWIKRGIHVGSGRKYKDSYYLQALAMSFISS